MLIDNLRFHLHFSSLLLRIPSGINTISILSILQQHVRLFIVPPWKYYNPHYIKIELKFYGGLRFWLRGSAQLLYAVVS